MQLSKNKNVNLLFFLSLVGMIASFIYLYFASERASNTPKPSFVCSSEKHGVILATKNNLYHTDKQGNILNIYNVKDLGFDEYTSDLTIVDDTLYIANAKSHDIYSCDFPIQECKYFTTVPNLYSLTAMKIAFTPDKQNFYVSSSQAHKVDYFFKNGQHLYTLDLHLKYPNGIAVTQDNTLIIADTNNHRILGIRQKDNDVDNLWEIPLTGLHSWPVNLTLTPDNVLWFTALDGFLDRGEVLVSSDYTNTNKIAFSPKKPTQLYKTQNGVIVGDADQYNFTLNNFNAQYSQIFGDSFIQKEFKKLYDEKEFYDTQILIAQIGIGLFIFFLIAIAIYEYKNTENKNELFTQSDNMEIHSTNHNVNIIPDQEGIVWLKMNSKTINLIKQSAWMLVATNILLIIAFVISDLIDIQIFAILGSMMLLTAIIMIYAYKMQKQRIGIKESRIYITDLFGNLVFDHAENTLFTGRRLFVDKRVIPLYNGYGELLFDNDEFLQYIQPLLQQAQRESEFQISIKKIFTGDFKTWLMIVIFTALFLTLFWLQFTGVI